jgi:hypothetical protein
VGSLVRMVRMAEAGSIAARERLCKIFGGTVEHRGCGTWAIAGDA